MILINEIFIKFDINFKLVGISRKRGIRGFYNIDLLRYSSD